MFCDNYTNIFDNLFSNKTGDPLQITGFVFLVKPTSYREVADMYQIGYSMLEGINNASDKGSVQRIFMCTDPVKVAEDIKEQLRILLKYLPYDITCFFKGDIKMIMGIFNQVSDKYISEGLGYYPKVDDLRKDFPDFTQDISVTGSKRLIKISTNDTTIVYMERCIIKKINYLRYLTGSYGKYFFKALYETILCKHAIHDMSTSAFLTKVYSTKTHVIPNFTVPLIKNLAEKYSKVNMNKGNSDLSVKSIHNTTHHYIINNLLKNGYIKYGKNLIDCVVEKHATDSRYVTVTVDSCGIPGPLETHTFIFEIKNGYYHQISDIQSATYFPRDDICISDDEF
jgi:hypothetical protein